MEVNQLVAHYKANYERKVFMTRLSHAMQNAYLMYIYDYPSELKNFADTFLAYLPFYIRNSDYFETVDENEDIDTQLIARSKNMRKNSKIIPHRQIASDGIYGELFFVSILKLFLQKNALDASLDLSCLDAKKITLLFEDGSVYDDYSKLIDYGVSNDLVMKLHDGHITIAELQEERYDKSIFDEYEQLMLSDFLSIL